MTSTESTIGSLRPTRQRTAVMEAMASIADFRSAQEIHALLESREAHVGLATVYRTLQLLSDVGVVDSLRAEDGELTYRRCSSHHHHHLVCRSCGAAVEVEGPAVEQWADSVSQEHGFVDVSHTLEIFGTCASCVTAAAG